MVSIADSSSLSTVLLPLAPEGKKISFDHLLVPFPLLHEMNKSRAFSMQGKEASEAFKSGFETQVVLGKEKSKETPRFSKGGTERRH